MAERKEGPQDPSKPDDAGNQGAGNQPRENLQSEVETLKADLRKLQGDLSGIAQVIMGMGRSQADDARHQAQQQWEQTLNRLQRHVEQKPMATVVTAFVIGLLAGKLFGR